jgi:hypothetical protein
MDNVQKHNTCTNVPSSQTFRSYFLTKIDYCCLCIGDDLITPVYVPPTRPPTTTPKVTPSTQCDDEDCVTGSGSGELTTEDNNTGTPEKGKLNCIERAPVGGNN